MKIIDTHCHLDYLKKQSLDETLRVSVEAGVDKIITISVDSENLDITMDLAQKYSNVYCSQGVHPHDSKSFTKKDYEKIKQRALQEKKVVAIGEIGLDYHYDHSPREIQRKIFEEQLQIACDVDLPVIIHSRESDRDTIDVLKNFSSQLKHRGVFHSFSSSIELAEYALSDNFFLGFNGMITFKGAENVRDALRITPIDKLLVETDAPFLAPTPHRGKENCSSYLPIIVNKMAQVKGLDVEELSTNLYKNSNLLFKLTHSVK